MSSKDDAQTFFQRLGMRMPAAPGATSASSSSSTGKPPTGGTRTTPLLPSTVAPTRTSALLTQVTRDPTPSSVTRRSSSRRRSTSLPPCQSTEDEATMRRIRLLHIQGQSKNLSPMDPTRFAPLLPPMASSNAGRKTLVLDVDETLVHSSFTPVHNYNDVLTCEVHGSTCTVYVAHRPHLHSFLDAVKNMFEIVIFTASVGVYCNPLMNRLDPRGALGPLRLFREHCSSVNGSYVKDLSLLGRPLDQIAIIDNSPAAYLFQPRNAIPILSWFDDPNDTEFLKLLPLLEALAQARDVYEVLDPYNASPDRSTD